MREGGSDAKGALNVGRSLDMESGSRVGGSDAHIASREIDIRPVVEPLGRGVINIVVSVNGA